MAGHHVATASSIIESSRKRSTSCVLLGIRPSESQWSLPRLLPYAIFYIFASLMLSKLLAIHIVSSVFRI